MAATHTSIVKGVLRDLDALPDNASKAAVERACVPLRKLFLRLGRTLRGRPFSDSKKRIFAMPAYRQLARRHGTLIQERL
jgi:hypothetical protein